ncbi:hypothetical protein QQS21_012670 [Conoideocrella luteorostrata]|uniref:Major facilitator superfamily (MFS) profile domain-containing protein n=1 Tax=Conoideocrella luteorostrata TaxID=1105319 RepID=A0AAJ0CAS2_9HYPO|nr:hypothetical protein QQS21_012670 [Conoideocrella luteorostrata]
MACSAGLLAGPFLGGVVYEHGGYYAVFGLAFELISLDIVLRLFLVERSHAIKWLEPTGGMSEPEQQATERVVIVLPLYAEETFGWKQTGQGLVFIPLIMPHILSPFTGSVMDKFPRTCRYLTSGAFFLSARAMVLLRLVTHDSTRHKVLLCALLTPIGICSAITMPLFFAEVFEVVEEKERQSPHVFGKGGAVALEFGITNVGFAAGGIVRPFFAGFIRQQAGWGTMGWALGLLAGATSVPLLLFMGGWEF